MPDLITYAEAAALAQRLDRAREQGALLLLDGVLEITQFRFQPEEGRIEIDLLVGKWAVFFNRETCTPAEFEAHWQGRITLHGRLPWPTGEAVTAETVAAGALLAQWAIEAWMAEEGALGAMQESAERLAEQCRALATETGENAGG